MCSVRACFGKQGGSRVTAQHRHMLSEVCPVHNTLSFLLACVHCVFRKLLLLLSFSQPPHSVTQCHMGCDPVWGAVHCFILLFSSSLQPPGLCCSLGAPLQGRGKVQLLQFSSLKNHCPRSPAPCLASFASGIWTPTPDHGGWAWGQIWPFLFHFG